MLLASPLLRLLHAALPIFPHVPGDLTGSVKICEDLWSLCMSLRQSATSEEAGAPSPFCPISPRLDFGKHTTSVSLHNLSYTCVSSWLCWRDKASSLLVPNLSVEGKSPENFWAWLRTPGSSMPAKKMCFKMCLKLSRRWIGWNKAPSTPSSKSLAISYAAQFVPAENQPASALVAISSHLSFPRCGFNAPLEESEWMNSEGKNKNFWTKDDWRWLRSENRQAEGQSHIWRILWLQLLDRIIALVDRCPWSGAASEAP